MAETDRVVIQPGNDPNPIERVVIQAAPGERGVGPTRGRIIDKNWALDLIIGVIHIPFCLSHSLSAYTQGAYGGIGVDATNANSAHIRAYSPGSYVFADSEYLGYVGIGFHYLPLLEYAGAATATIFGDANVPDVWQN